MIEHEKFVEIIEFKHHSTGKLLDGHDLEQLKKYARSIRKKTTIGDIKKPVNKIKYVFSNFDDALANNRLIQKTIKDKKIVDVFFVQNGKLVKI